MDALEAAPAPSPSSRVLVAATWLLPAAVFLVSGIAKIASPEGAVPRSIAGLVEKVPFPVVLRSLGGFEVLLAAALCLPATRRPARYVAFALLAVFSVFVAWNAGDTRFVEKCGCFGDVRVSAGSGPLAGHQGILFRNALIAFVLALGAYLEGRRAVPTLVAAGRAFAAAAIVLGGTLFVAERTLRVDAEARVQATEMGAVGARIPRRRFPDVALVDPEGQATRSSDVLRGGDQVVFFSTTCPHCRNQAPQWEALSHRLVVSGARLVPIAVDDAKAGAAFLAEHGAPSLRPYALVHRNDAAVLGVFGVPHWLALDADRRIASDDAASGGATFADALSLIGHFVEGFERETWDRLASRLLGAGSSSDALVAAGPTVRYAAVRGPDGPRGHLAVVAPTAAPSRRLEFALGIDPAGKIVDVLLLSAGSFVQVADPTGRLLDLLKGAKIGDAAKVARAATSEPSLAAPIWASVIEPLTRLGEALR